MRISRPYKVIIALTMVFASVATAAFLPSNPEQVSIGIGQTGPSSGNPDLSPDSEAPSLCPNANILAFQSAAANLVDEDTNGQTDLFITKDGGNLSRISVGTDENGNDVESNGQSFEPAISPVLPDGTYAVAFTSLATNLVPNFLPLGYDGYTPVQVYVRIPRLRKTILVSAALPGGEFIFGNGDSTHPSITSVIERDGPRYIVTFATFASNIAPDTSSQAPNPLPYSRIVVAIIDGKTGNILRKNILLPVDSSGMVVDPLGDLLAPVVNGQGDAITFLTSATNLGWNSSGGNPPLQVVLATRRNDSSVIFPTPSPTPAGLVQSQTGTALPPSPPVARFASDFKLISKVNTPDGTNVRQPGIGNSFAPVISFSGDYIAFGTDAFNLFNRTGTTLALWDRSSDQLTAVNSDANGVVPQDSSPDKYALRRNGRLILFSDSSSSLTDDNDTNGVADLFAKDLVDGQIARLNKRFTAEGGEPLQSDAGVLGVAIGGLGYNVDRSTVAFVSDGNLVTVGSQETGNVFRTSLRYPPPRLVGGAPLQSPPDVKVSGRTCTIVLQRFSGISVSSANLRPLSEPALSDGGDIKSLGTKVSYDIRLKNSSTRKTTKRTSTSVRVTLRNLKPGTYSIKYRAQGKKGRKTVSTKFSPSVSITIKS